MSDLNDYSVKSVKKETTDTTSFVLEGPSISHKAGQFIMLNLEVDGKLMKRAYSIASSPKRGLIGEIELCVKAVPGGNTSQIMQNVKLGDVFKVSGPFGHFVFDANAQKDIVLLAAGSGVAPCVSMLEQIKDEELETKAVLIYSNKTPEDIIYHEKLDSLAEAENISVFYTLTRCEGVDFDGALCGRIDAKMFETVCGKDLGSKDFFICGPNVFTKSMRELLTNLGVKKEKIHFESYG